MKMGFLNKPVYKDLSEGFKWKHLIAISLALIFLEGMNFVDVPFVELDWTGQTTLDDFITDALVPQGEEDGVQVNVKVYCYEGWDEDTPGLAGTASDQVIRVYKLDGDSYVLLESVTTSSGTITLTRMYWTGSDLYLQARQGAVATADPYVSPVVKRTVPSSSSAEFSDTCSLDAVYVRDVTGTAPTLRVTDGSNNAISDNTQNFFNLTDTTIKISLDTIDADTFYGPKDFTDANTGNVYDGGVFFVWKGTVAQPFSGYKYTWSDPTNVYYIWEITDYIVDDSSAGVATDMFSIQLQTDGSNLVADATVILDVNDIIWLRTAGMGAADLIDGGGVAVTGVTTKAA
jgi:hypothetical protein